MLIPTKRQQLNSPSSNAPEAVALSRPFPSFLAWPTFLRRFQLGRRCLTGHAFRGSSGFPPSRATGSSNARPPAGKSRGRAATHRSAPPSFLGRPLPRWRACSVAGRATASVRGKKGQVRSWHESSPREPEVTQRRPVSPRLAQTSPGAMVLDSLARIIKVQLPAYLKRLPLPESVGGFLRLTG